MQGSNNQNRIRNNSAQGNGRINTVEMAWERYKNGRWETSQRLGKLEHKEETQRKSPTNLGRRDREDLEEKSCLKEARVYLETVSVGKLFVKPLHLLVKEFRLVKWRLYDRLRQQVVPKSLCSAIRMHVVAVRNIASWTSLLAYRLTHSD